jgi:hypothetical protein
MTSTLYDPSKPGHKAPCRRIAHAPECLVIGEGRCGPECVPAPCRANGDHPAGEHLDQRHEFYDGPGLSLDGLPLSVRDSAKTILRAAPDVMPELVDMANEINWLHQSLTRVSVEKDRQVREAMRRSESCEHHGQEIEELGRALHAANQRAEKIERARVAVLGFLHQVDGVVRSPRADLTVKGLLDALGRAVKATRAAPDRAWKS